MRKSIIFLFAASALCPPASSQTFSPERIRADVAFLADDLLEGRNAGTRGYDIAARWVASQYEGLGLKPAGTSGWYQQVPFVVTKADPAKPSAVTIDGVRLISGTEAIVSPSPLATTIDETADVVFVGYGLEDQRFGLDDYKGQDVRGKVVAFLYGTPSGLPSDVAATMAERKTETAEAKGAVGVITLLTPAILDRYPWKMIVENSGQPSLRWIEPNGKAHVDHPGLRLTAGLGPEAARRLFKNAPASWDEIIAEIGKNKEARPAGFAVPGKVRFERFGLHDKISSPNVMGMIEGGDPKLAGEVVMLTAHLDHDGIVPAKNGDSIMNGAMDNAAGVATMIEAARAFVASGVRPRRSVLFVALTAEEKGLLGSEYLAHYPTLKDKRLVANVNLDMPILTYDFQDVIAFGAEHSTMGATVERAVSKIGLKVSPDPTPEENLFTRSDHYSFVQKGVPALFLKTGFAGPGKAASEQFRKHHYHQVSDQIDLPFNWDAGAKFARVNYLIARELADADEAPKWYSGSFFGDKFAAGQAKVPKP